MTFFENILKKRLGNATSDKGVVPDDLWASIEQSLPPEKQKGSPFNWTTLFLALLGLILALGVSLNIFLQEEVEDVSVTLTAEASNENALEGTQAPAMQVHQEGEEVKKAPLSEKRIIAEANAESPRSVQDKMGASNISDSAKRMSVGNAQRSKDEVITRDEPSGKNVTSTKTYEPVNEEVMADGNMFDESSANALVSRENQTERKVPEVRDEAEAVVAKAMATNDLEAFAPRNEIPVRKLEVETSIALLERGDKEPVVENFKSIIPMKQLRRPRLDLGAFVGTNMLRHKYPSAATDDLADALNASRGEALGQSATLEIGYRLKPGLKVYTGLEILKTHTTFRYTQQWDTVTMRNGQQIEAIAIRRVQHNNRQTLLSVPLMLEKTIASGRWEAGLAAGVSFNYLAQQTGRTLNALQEVVTYSSGGGESLPSPDFYLSYQIRPSINYRLNNQVSIQARADFRLQQYGKSALYELSFNSMLLGGSFGVVFGL